MISFEIKGDSKICKEEFFVPDNLNCFGNFGFVSMYNLKIYLNGKLLRKKIKTIKNGWRFIKPLKLTKNDILTYTWETNNDNKNNCGIK